MSIANYAIIRARLDNPQIVVHDPCVVLVAADDDDWSAPADWLGVRKTMDSFPLRTSSWLALEAASSVLSVFEQERDGTAGGLGPRQDLEALADWLCSDVDMETLLEFADDANVTLLATPGGCASDAAHLALRSVWGNNPRVDAASAAHRASAAAFEHGSSIALFYSRWWARCRALLPIADVTTAEIEWGDIELPPRPLNGDLPG